MYGSVILVCGTAAVLCIEYHGRQRGSTPGFLSSAANASASHRVSPRMKSKRAKGLGMTEFLSLKNKACPGAKRGGGPSHLDERSKYYQVDPGSRNLLRVLNNPGILISCILPLTPRQAQNSWKRFRVEGAFGSKATYTTNTHQHRFF